MNTQIEKHLDLKVGDLIKFTNKGGYKVTITVSRVDKKSWYCSNGGRNSYGTLKGYQKYPDFKIIKTNKMSNNQTPSQIIGIPRISNDDLFESNMEKAYQKGVDHCPCCGKAITNPKYFFNSIWGGSAYPANDQTQYNDAWVMGVGSECRKRFPDGYVFSK